MATREQQVEDDFPLPEGRFEAAFEVLTTLQDLTNLCCIKFNDDATTYHLSVGTDITRNLQADDIFTEVLVDEEVISSIRGLAFTGHVSAVMLKNPGLMAKLLEEVVLDALQNLSHIFFFLPPEMYNIPKFLFFFETYILHKIIEDQPFSLDNMNIATADKKFVSISEINDPDYNQSIESSFCRPQQWKLPLMEKLLQKPNLDHFHALKQSQHCFDSIICSSGSSQLKDLFLEEIEEWQTDDWLPLLLAGLKQKDHHKNLKQKDHHKNQRGKKRKRSQHHHQIGRVGTLNQLKRIQLVKFTLMKHSHLLSLTDTLQKNNTIRHLILDKVILQEYNDAIRIEDENIVISGQRLERNQAWQPFVDLIRHNNTLSMIRVRYNINNLISIVGTVENRPYCWEEPLSDALTHYNHKISSICFGYRLSSGESFNLRHSDNTQYWLDLNYFGLGIFGSCTTISASSEGFPEVLISAVQKDKEGREDRWLVPCLFQLLTNNPSLLVNHL